MAEFHRCDSCGNETQVTVWRLGARELRGSEQVMGEVELCSNCVGLMKRSLKASVRWRL